MMETAKIRKAGYAIRHTYKDFVLRYRVLVKGIITRSEIKPAALKICTEVLGTKNDYAFGKTKIFLREHQDRLLESMRAEIYARSIDVIQRAFRRLIFRKFMSQYRNAAIVIQKNWRARGPRKSFLAMQRGFHRLQALVNTREVNMKFQKLRSNIVNLQARCRGNLARRNLAFKIAEKARKMMELSKLRSKEEQELKSSGHPKWKQEAEQSYHTRIAVLNKELEIDKDKKFNHQSSSIEEEYKVIDDLFDFINDPEWQTPKIKPKPAARNIKAPTFQVSRMITFLEAKSRDVRHIPSKLLSRPMNYYNDNSTTRL